MNYYGKFIPNIATILHPLYQLLNSSVPWSWTQERDEAFNKAKTLLTLSMYKYSVSFKPSTSHLNADAISRLPLSDVPVDPPVPPETVLLLEQILESPITVDEIRNWTQRDPTLAKVHHFIMSGWPNELNTTDVSLAPYWNRKMELSTQEGVVL